MGSEEFSTCYMCWMYVNRSVASVTSNNKYHGQQGFLHIKVVAFRLAAVCGVHVVQLEHVIVGGIVTAVQFVEKSNSNKFIRSTE